MERILVSNILKIVSIVLCFLFFGNTLKGQDLINISSRVIDKKTRSPLAFANIGIKGESIGTVSNEIGEFDFFLSSQFLNDSLVISFLGYKTFKEKISNLKASKEIGLEELPTLLEEITVSANSAEKIIKDAQKAITDNYPIAPYLMEGFHRSWEKLDSADVKSYPGTLIEAAVMIYDPGYDSKKTKEKIYINEVRKSNLNAGWNYSNGNWLSNLLERNLIKYPRNAGWLFIKNFFDFSADMKYSWDGTIQFNGENLSVIKVEVKNSKNFPAVYKIYVSETDHAILRFELSGAKNEIEYSMGEWHTEMMDVTYIFRRYENRVFLQYARNQYKIRKLDVKNRKVLRTEDYFREVLVNDIKLDSVKEIYKLLDDDNMARSLALSKKPYDEQFWKNYNVIKANPLNKEVILWLEQKEKLNDQFKKEAIDPKKKKAN
ncbi:MAG: hypothetical protein HOP08_20725 [Cyclobacteriaceae bacterium]|nr:hypothetical protein [Cyclobacteriaceae bacterium]